MNDRERLVRILRELNLPHGRWLLQGSGVLVLHNLPRKKPMGDVDIFVATRTWFELFHDGQWDVWTTDPDDPARRCDPPYLVRMMHGIEVNVFSAWRVRHVGDMDLNLLMHNAEYVDGFPCTTLQFMLDWKREVGRAKDVDDIRLIEEAIGTSAA